MLNAHFRRRAVSERYLPPVENIKRSRASKARAEKIWAIFDRRSWKYQILCSNHLVFSTCAKHTFSRVSWFWARCVPKITNVCENWRRERRKFERFEQRSWTSSGFGSHFLVFSRCGERTRELSRVVQHINGKKDSARVKKDLAIFDKTWAMFNRKMQNAQFSVIMTFSQIF